MSKWICEDGIGTYGQEKQWKFELSGAVNPFHYVFAFLGFVP